MHIRILFLFYLFLFLSSCIDQSTALWLPQGEGMGRIDSEARPSSVEQGQCSCKDEGNCQSWHRWAGWGGSESPDGQLRLEIKPCFSDSWLSEAKESIAITVILEITAKDKSSCKERRNCTKEFTGFIYSGDVAVFKAETVYITIIINNDTEP